MKKRFASAALFLVFVLLLPACQKGEPPDVAAENLFRAIKRNDDAVTQKYMGKETPSSRPEMTEESAALAKEADALMWEKLSYEVNDFYEEKKTATVDVKVTCLDMSEIFKACMQQAVLLAVENAQAPEGEQLTREQFEEKTSALLLEMMEKEDAPMLTDVVVLEMKRNGSSWRVTNTQEVKDAVTAGADSLIKQMKEAMESAKPQT